MMKGKRTGTRRVAGMLAGVMLAVAVLGAAIPFRAFAKTDESAPASSLKVYMVYKNHQGETVSTLLHDYSYAEMENLASGDHVSYSSIDAFPICVYTLASGVYIKDLIQNAAGYANDQDVSSWNKIKLYATDNWSCTYSKDYLFGKQRSYYPALFTTWDADNKQPGGGADANPQPVDPMFAISSYQTRVFDHSNPLDHYGEYAAQMNRDESFRFCLGMTAEDVDVSVSTTSKYGRWVNRMDIVLPSASDSVGDHKSVTGIKLDQNTAAVKTGNTVQLTATIIPQDATDQGVKWTSNNGSVASVSDDGLVTGVKTGSAVITAASSENPKLTASCTVTVKDNIVKVTGMTLDKTSCSIKLGSTKQITAVVLPYNATDRTVAWKSGDTSVASVDGSGLVTAKGKGTATITATTKDGSFTASCEVTVLGEGSTVSYATEVALDTTSCLLKIGDTKKLNAAVTPSDAVDGDLYWSSDMPSVASVDTNGLVTAMGEGIANILVSTEDGSPSAACTVVVQKAGSMGGIALNKSAVTLAAGSTMQLKGTMVPEAAQAALQWTSINPDVAAVDEKGLVAAKSAGTAEITASNADHTMTAACAVTVTKGEGPARFTDLTGNWAKDSILQMVEFGALTGCPDNTFRPNQTVTRAEFVTMVVKTLELMKQVKVISGVTFGDTAEHWAKDYISTGVLNGFVTGYNEKTFGPNDQITREQMAVILTRAFSLTAKSSGTGFQDASKISTWAKNAVDAAVGNGIMTGKPGNLFAPGENATRAQAATVLLRLVQMKGYL